jgi:superfamily II DNA or RNA helicase
MTLTSYHAKYFANDLTRRATGGIDRLSMSLFDAAVDINPHQVEAALFALHSPLLQGVILADEVGLGKTIEAGIVLCQLWAERRRKLLILCPASIRKQWALELLEKFDLPAIVLDSKTEREFRRDGRDPFTENAILILSFNYANALREQLRSIPWDLVVIDEAHKLRNAYRTSNKAGQGIRWATEERRKILLTATPLQNSLLELYGLSTLIDEHIFGDINAFRSRYTGAGASLVDLRQRLSDFCKRTLRNQVTEFIRYTERRAITRPFRPSDNEHSLYEAVSAFLQRPDSIALPTRQRHLTALILRKLLASSSRAIAGTLDALRVRLEAMLEDKANTDDALVEDLIQSEEMDDELLDEILATNEDEPQQTGKESAQDKKKIREEIDVLSKLSAWAKRIDTDTKTRTLVEAIKIGFSEMVRTGAAKKALIFTESRRTQDYLKEFLDANGYAGQIVTFNGTNGGPEATAIYDRWLKCNRESGRSSGSRAIDIRAALIEHFRDQGSIMLATEAGAEGINLQFCSLVINYDLPWNPQRVEQRIGRCHRYGQKHDVVVINFLNERNDVDRRVLELLTEKFSLFSGVFGASDEVLGSIESGVDFEKRILAIYQECRTHEQIEAAFKQLQQEMDEQIRTRMDETRRTLFETFDEDVHQRMRIQLADARAQLDRIGQRFWALTRFTLAARAHFDDSALTFDLQMPPVDAIPRGRYHLISKSVPRESADGIEDHNQFLYRLSHPLGEHVLQSGKDQTTDPAHVTFDVSSHPTRLHVIEALRGRSGFLTLIRVQIDSYEREEQLLFSGFDENGTSIAPETLEKLFSCDATASVEALPAPALERLAAESGRYTSAAISRSLEINSAHFNQAREKLEKWAEDVVLGAERALLDTKEQIKALRRLARQAVTLEEQRQIQEKIQRLERQQRRQRQEIFAVEDDVMVKRDALIDSLEKRLSQRTQVETLFTVRWSVQ